MHGKVSSSARCLELPRSPRVADHVTATQTQSEASACITLGAGLSFAIVLDPGAATMVSAGCQLSLDRMALRRTDSDCNRAIHHRGLQ
jgi:hypothetical protein